MARLWRRNLGRDDRCISAHGRESRRPFLDEKVVALLRTARIPLVSANGSSRSLKELPAAVDQYTHLATQLQQGSEAAFASLTWSLILHVDVGSRPSCPSHCALGELLTWARDTCEGYAGVDIGRTRYAWSNAFADGLAWCAMVDAHDPSLLDLNEVSQMEAEERLLVLFQVAEAKLDVPCLWPTPPRLSRIRASPSRSPPSCATRCTPARCSPSSSGWRRRA